MNDFNRKDVYTRVTDRIIADLEKGVRSWLKTWSAQHPAGNHQTVAAQRYMLNTSSSVFQGADFVGVMGALV